MTGGYRTQFGPPTLRNNEIPLEGEPRWDAINRKVGFWNFEYNKFNWFRIPGEGENENYTPEHQFNGALLRFKNPDGTWGDYIDLSVGVITEVDLVTNSDTSITLTFIVHNIHGDYSISCTTQPLRGDDGINGWSPEYAIKADGVRLVNKIVDWVGGEGTKPPINVYVGAAGYVSDITQAVDIRGPAGLNDWNALSNKPTFGAVAFSNSYIDLDNRPELKPVATSGLYDDLTNKPAISTVGVTGNYTDLTNKPALKPVAVTGLYDDLTNKPTFATVATTGNSDNLTEGTTKKLMTTTERTKLGNLTISGAINLDNINTRVNSLDQAVVIRGTWAANASTFPGAGTAQAGDAYIVSTAGTVNGQSFIVGDRILAITDNASTTVFANNWFKEDYTDSVSTVNGRVGTVTTQLADITDMTATARTLNSQNTTADMVNYLSIGDAAVEYFDGPNASTAISSGVVVALNDTTGLIDPISGTEVTALDPEQYAFETGQVTDMSSSYDPTTKRLVISYYNASYNGIGVVYGKKVAGTYVYGKVYRIYGASVPQIVRNPNTGRMTFLYRSAAGGLEGGFIDLSTDDANVTGRSSASEYLFTTMSAFWDPQNSKVAIVTNDATNTKVRFIIDDTAVNCSFSATTQVVAGNHSIKSVAVGAAGWVYVFATTTTPAGFYCALWLANIASNIYNINASPAPVWTTIGTGTGTITGNYGMVAVFDAANGKVLVGFTNGTNLSVYQATASTSTLTFNSSTLSVNSFSTVYRLAMTFDTVNARAVFAVGNSAGRLHFGFLTTTTSTTAAPTFSIPSTMAIDSNDPSTAGGGVCIASVGAGEFHISHATPVSVITNILATNGGNRTDTGGINFASNSSYENLAFYDVVNQVTLYFFVDSGGVWSVAVKDDPANSDMSIATNAYPKVSSSSTAQAATMLRVIYDSVSNRHILFYLYSSTLYHTVIQNTTNDVYAYSPTLVTTASSVVGSITNFDVDYDNATRSGMIAYLNTSNYCLFLPFTFDGTIITTRTGGTVSSTSSTPVSIVFDPINREYLYSTSYSSVARLIKLAFNDSSNTAYMIQNVPYASAVTPRDLVYLPSLKRFAFIYIDSTTYKTVVDLLEGDASNRTVSSLILNNNGISSYNARLVWDYTNEVLLALYVDTYGVINYAMLKINENDNLYIYQKGHLGYSYANTGNLGKACYSPTQKAFIVTWYESTGLVMKIAKLRVAQETTNASKWLGITKNAVASGSPARITGPGAIATNLSGLTPGKTYYIKSDGTLTTTKNTRPIGRALSASRLLLEYKRE